MSDIARPVAQSLRKADLGFSRALHNALNMHLPSVDACNVN